MTALHLYAVSVGVLEILIGVPLLISRDATVQLMRKAMDNVVVMRVVGWLFLTLSVLVLLEDPTVGSDTGGLIRLLAWLTAIKMVLVCWKYDIFLSIREWWMRQAGTMMFAGIVAVVIGVLLLRAAPML